MSGVGRIVGATRLAHGVAEVAIVEATSVHSHVESRVAPLAKEAEATTSRTIREISQWLKHELDTVASGTIAASTQNTHAAIEGLRTEFQAKFKKDVAEL